MKKYKVSYHTSVELEIKIARKWYIKISSDLEKRFIQEIKSGITKISENPLHYQVKYKTIRTHYIETFPYGIYYMLNNDVITILGILHTSRNPKTLKDKL